tara:strand:- start:363 stop:776 length:414 start_codon:yes stop_codon:yes gene_type:complete
MTTFDEIINFYKSFNRYKNNTYEELYYHIEQSINFNQYKIFKDKEIYGFVNWAMVNKKTEDYFLKTGEVLDWHCGDLMIHIDFLANKNIRKIYKWSKNNLAKIIGLGNSTNWIRLNNTNKIRNIVKKNIKDSWLWVE